MSSTLEEQLRNAVNSVPGWSWDEVDVAPLDGGVTNANFVAIKDGKKHFMKVFGSGTDSFINRDASNDASVQAHAMGIGPRVLHFDKKTGLEVAEFLLGYRASTNADYAHRVYLESVVDLYKIFHSGQPLSETKTCFDMIDEHIEQGQSLGAIYPVDIDWLMKQYMKSKSAFLAAGLDLVPCHNDPMPGNFMVSEKQGILTDMKMIDFEYASNNERAYELGMFLGEMFIDEKTSLEMVERYYGHASMDIVARVTVGRALADMKWGSWAVQQRQLQSWDFDYQKYGIWKYARARMVFNDPRWDDWLRAL
ncbi:choline kinase family protein [Roseobacter litoralis]|uniref:Choline/ethanolamine kinase n=1 Tax=Roseobacter litoralis (strain ATCC 49566 / DSM 6996 / JCM 21268 / NBRC 15278 / OCh 149) TaxID=391595 RepID=F7ZG55_ROSLO|nr:choline kinase family protein [Roseobacter litoralis]AEI94786.1 putative choline/ethanolamine kinase [Roseobacter litoralis Och 149]